MASGEPFTEGQLRDVARAVHNANDETGLHFSVFIGEPEGPARRYAERLHAALGERAPYAALVLVAPGSRALEIVTGPNAARRLTDRGCALAALSMRSSFVGGDLVGGIVNGLRMLAETAGQLRGVTAGPSSRGQSSGAAEPGGSQQPDSQPAGAPESAGAQSAGAPESAGH